MPRGELVRVKIMLGTVSLRKLAFLVVLTDAILASVAAALAVNSGYFSDWNFWPAAETPVHQMVAVADNTKRSQSDAEPQEPVELPPVRTVNGGRVAGSEFNSKAAIAAAAIFALFFLAPAIAIYCFFLLLRRHIEQFGALIQIHNAFAPPAIVGLPTFTAPAAAPPMGGAAELHAQTPTPQVNFTPPAAPQGGPLFERLFEETIQLEKELGGQR